MKKMYLFLVIFLLLCAPSCQKESSVIDVPPPPPVNIAPANFFPKQVGTINAYRVDPLQARNTGLSSCKAANLQYSVQIAVNEVGTKYIRYADLQSDLRGVQTPFIWDIQLFAQTFPVYAQEGENRWNYLFIDDLMKDWDNYSTGEGGTPALTAIFGRMDICGYVPCKPSFVLSGFEPQHTVQVPDTGKLYLKIDTEGLVRNKLSDYYIVIISE